MIRIFLILLFFSVSRGFSQSSIYDLSIDKADGTSQSLSAFKSKKMLIAIVPIALIDDNLERYLDSLQISHPDIAVILQPGLVNNQTSFDSTNTPQLTTKALNAKANQYLKSSGINQGVLAKWLSNDALNGHFGTEFGESGNFFFIDSTGQLIGVSSGIPSVEYLSFMLNQMATSK